MSVFFVHAAAILLFCFGAFREAAAADFLVTTDFINISNTEHHFVARILDENVIEVARNEVGKNESWMIISGTINKTAVDWNPGWSYHLIPETIEFGEFFIEVCDATAPFVEDNLADAGGAFLPNLFWCPWSTRVLQEITSSPVDTVSPTMAPTTSEAWIRSAAIVYYLLMNALILLG